MLHKLFISYHYKDDYEASNNVFIKKYYDENYAKIEMYLSVFFF